MNKAKRVWNIVSAIIMIHAAVILMVIPNVAFGLIAMFVGVMLTFYGLKYLLYYFTHACHMVGGKWLLLVGLILFDLGVFSSLLYDQAQAIMIIYVATGHVVAAILNMVRAVGNKKDGNPGWMIDFAQCIGNIIQVALCLIFIHLIVIPVFIYCSGVIYSAVLRIIQACKRTEIVYVQ